MLALVDKTTQYRDTLEKAKGVARTTHGIANASCDVLNPTLAYAKAPGAAMACGLLRGASQFKSLPLAQAAAKSGLETMEASARQQPKSPQTPAKKLH